MCLLVSITTVTLVSSLQVGPSISIHFFSLRFEPSGNTCSEEEMIHAPSYLFHRYAGPASLLVDQVLQFIHIFIFNASRTRSLSIFMKNKNKVRGSQLQCISQCTAQQLASIHVIIASTIGSLYSARLQVQNRLNHVKEHDMSVMSNTNPGVNFSDSP